MFELGCRSINQSAKRRWRQKTTKLAALEVIYARASHNTPAAAFCQVALGARVIQIAHLVPHTASLMGMVIKKAPSPRECDSMTAERACLLINLRSRGWRRRLCGSILFPHDIVSRSFSLGLRNFALTVGITTCTQVALAPG